MQSPAIPGVIAPVSCIIEIPIPMSRRAGGAVQPLDGQRRAGRAGDRDVGEAFALAFGADGCGGAQLKERFGAAPAPGELVKPRSRSVECVRRVHEKDMRGIGAGQAA